MIRYDTYFKNNEKKLEYLALKLKKAIEIAKEYNKNEEFFAKFKFIS